MTPKAKSAADRRLTVVQVQSASKKHRSKESLAIEAVQKVIDLQKQIATVKGKLKKKVGDTDSIRTEIDDLK